MKANDFVQCLETNREVFRALLSDVPVPQQKWKSSAEQWGLLEIVCHLYDEEREDFRARVKHCLHSPDDPMPGIDPVGWVISRDYLGQDYIQKVTDFTDERNVSVDWLKSLENVDWDQAYMHPKSGPLSARHYLANWLAHDYHHIRQINRVKYNYLKAISGEDLGYAGRW